MRQLFAILLITVTYGLSAQRGGEQKIHWRDRPAGEMPAETAKFMSLEKGRILCYLSNDESYYYVDMIIPDVTIQKMVIDAGMNIWFDTEGKKRKEVAVRYPAGANNVRAQLRSKGDRRTEKENRIIVENRPLSMAYEISFAGFGEDGPRRNVDAAVDPKYKGSIFYNDEGDLIYFLRIPKEIVKVQDAKRGQQPFSVGIEYGATRAVSDVVPQAAAGGRPGGAAPAGRTGAAASAAVPGQPPAKIVWVRGLLPAGR